MIIEKIQNLIESEWFKRTHNQFIKFVIVGILSTIINYACFYIFLEFLSVYYLVASSIGFISGVFIGYKLNKSWTFSVKESFSKRDVAKYYVVYIISLILSLIFLKITVDFIGINSKIANIIAIGITTCTNFIGTKFLVFKK